MTNKIYIFALNIDAETYLKMYAGKARDVVARATNGQSVRFPASALRRFVAHDGVRGVFEIEVSDGNRLLDLRRKKA